MYDLTGMIKTLGELSKLPEWVPIEHCLEHDHI